MRPRSWTKADLIEATQKSFSIRQILKLLHLRESGGNYVQVQKYLKYYKIDTRHLKGRAWNKGLRGIGKPQIPLAKILTKNSTFQSYKLKRLLFAEGLKEPRCEICGWAVRSPNGRLPLELDHINGNRWDNRLVNLRILCPNCHSLQPTHRGRNTRGRVLE